MRLYSTSPSRRFPHRIAGLVLVGVAGLASCGTDAARSAPAAASSTGTVAPEDINVDPAVVMTGLTKLPATIASAIAAIDTPDAEAKVAAIEQEWASFEGTVRDTDPDIYLAIEDQLHPVQDQIKAGDATKAIATAATLSDLFTQYLTKHPG